MKNTTCQVLYTRENFLLTSPIGYIRVCWALKKINKILLNRYWESANKLVKKIIIYVSPFFDEEIGENLDFFF